MEARARLGARNLAPCRLRSHLRTCNRQPGAHRSGANSLYRRLACTSGLRKKRSVLISMAGGAEGQGIEPYDVLIFGDSITEAFLGTSMGFDDPSYDENKRAFQELIASRYRAGVRSMAGDEAAQLLWRLRNGQGPRGLSVRVCMVMIGANDVAQQAEGWGQADLARVAGRVFAGVQMVLDEVAAQAPEARVVALSLLPLQPPWCGVDGPSYQPVVDAVNELLREYAAERAPRFLYADCATPFLRPGGEGRVDLDLMPDGVHPMGRGGRVLAECVLRALREALGEEGGGSLDGSSGGS